VAIRQRPAAQAAVHTTPQAPQFLASVARLASQPFADKPSQLLKPGEQSTTAHVP
jgi:hypothetical protein